MRTNSLANLSPVLGVLLPFVVGSCGYKPCSDLEIGDRFEVTIEEIYFGSDCRPEFELGVGSILELEVTDTVRGERCESATGTVFDPAGRVSFDGPLVSESEDTAHNEFFGFYDVRSPRCSGSAEVSFALGRSRSGSKKKGMNVNIYSSACDSTCQFSAYVMARQL